MIIVDIFFIILLLVLSFFVLYLVVLASKAVSLKYDDTTSVDPSFFIIIPVHNEEKTIHHLIRSISDIDYPKEKLNFLFVADHCSDNSAQIIKSAGYPVFERSCGDKGKPAALADGVMQCIKLLKNNYDAIAVFDADNIIDKSFFKHIANKLITGVDVIQGNTTIKNHKETVFLRVNHLNMVVTNRFKELARHQWGGTCRLRGHGMVFSKSILKTLNWETTSLVEDQKMLLDLVLSNIRVHWDHKAIVSSYFPTTMADSAVQRKRWAGGKNIMVKSAVESLYKKFKSDKSFIALDMIVDFIMPSYAILVGLSFLGFVSAFFLYGLNIISAGYLFITVLFLLYYFIGCSKENVPFKEFLWFFAAPFFILWRMWIYLCSLRGTRSWH